MSRTFSIYGYRYEPLLLGTLPSPEYVFIDNEPVDKTINPEKALVTSLKSYIFAVLCRFNRQEHQVFREERKEKIGM